MLVQVTPHINAGGLVTLEVDAEVSDPGSPAAPGDAPPINTRSVQTILAVPSGETMVMGGLDPGAQGQHVRWPAAGEPASPSWAGLSGQQTLTQDRTELMLFITPRVVENATDVDTVIDDLRRRMDSIDEYFPGGNKPRASTRRATAPTCLSRQRRRRLPRWHRRPPPRPLRGWRPSRWSHRPPGRRTVAAAVQSNLAAAAAPPAV